MAEYMDPAMDAMEDAAGTAAEEAYHLRQKLLLLQSAARCYGAVLQDGFDAAV